VFILQNTDVMIIDDVCILDAELFVKTFMLMMMMVLLLIDDIVDDDEQSLLR